MEALAIILATDLLYSLHVEEFYHSKWLGNRLSLSRISDGIPERLFYSWTRIDFRSLDLWTARLCIRVPLASYCWKEFSSLQWMWPFLLPRVLATWCKSTLLPMAAFVSYAETILSNRKRSFWTPLMQLICDDLSLQANIETKIQKMTVGLTNICRGASLSISLRASASWKLWSSCTPSTFRSGTCWFQLTMCNWFRKQGLATLSNVGLSKENWTYESSSVQGDDLCSRNGWLWQKFPWQVLLCSLQWSSETLSWFPSWYYLGVTCHIWSICVFFCLCRLPQPDVRWRGFQYFLPSQCFSSSPHNEST